MTETVGKLEFLTPRSAFNHEAHHFTVWMQENIDALCDRLGFKLAVIEREAKAGGYNVDLLCEDESGNRVIIENQLEESNHGHLGQLITYLVNLEAKSAIWVTPKPRREHEFVIDWLNKFTPQDISFYLVKVEVVKIGDSVRAPLFTVISKPDAQTKRIGEKQKELSERNKAQFDFWQGLALELGNNKIGNKITPSSRTWVRAAPSGKPNIEFNYWLNKNACGINFYIDVDKESGERNKIYFDALLKNKDEIEKEIGDVLQWWRLDDARASIISLHVSDEHGWMDPEEWPGLQKQMADALPKFIEVFKKQIKSMDF